MKHIIATGVFFITFYGYSQTAQTAGNIPENLNQYLWSFSKATSKQAEKNLIDFQTIDNWRTLGLYLAVSNDGNYFAYNTSDRSVTRKWARGLDSLVIQSTRNSWRRTFASRKQGSFTADNRQYIFQKDNLLYFLKLGSAQMRIVENVAAVTISQHKWLAYQVKGKDSLILQNLATGKQLSFSGITKYAFDNSGEWLVWQANNRDLVLYNLVTTNQKRFPSVADYLLAEHGKALLIKTADANLQYVELPGGSAKIIWNGNANTTVVNQYFDPSGNRLVFTVVDNGNANNSSTFYYEAGMEKAVLKVNHTTADIPSGLFISNASFTDNGRYLKLSLQSVSAAPVKFVNDFAGLEVWNHKDVNLQFSQAKQVADPKSYNAIINIKTGNLLFLESDTKKISLIQGDFLLTKNDYAERIGDRFWENKGKGKEDSAWIINLKDGSSKLLPTSVGERRFWFSPGGKYLVNFNLDNNCHYFSYNLYTDTLKNISVNVPAFKLGLVNRYEDSGLLVGNLAAWIENDESVLVYDDYDIWKLDLTGKEKAVNITNGFGNSAGIVLNLFNTDRYSGEVPIIKTSDSLVLRAYNWGNKQNGFYKKPNLKVGAPTKLYMGNYYVANIEGCHDVNLSNLGKAPVKAKSNETWIVQRQSISDAPNYYKTNDFKSFKKLTNFQPQQQFRWLKDELHSFRHLDGREGQGILYKPDNFDSTKKYPVLIIFYDNLANKLNQFPDPTYIDHSVQPAQSPIWLVNNGYLVFTPDIYTTPLKHGASAFSVIEGAAKYLKQLPYVDLNKLGCASHSWSAHLGAYIFTHSYSIAATAISEGMSYGNMIDMAFQPFDGESHLHQIENVYQSGELWKNKDQWLDQTTVLNVDKSTSPLLLLCNKKSRERWQDQTFQLFTALRRLDKNVWWLNYDNGGHTLDDLKELKDYTIRYTQFFDHYLKNIPAPQWMTKGIPYRLKGIESGYQLDPQGTCNLPNGEPCFICQAWNAQFKKTPRMFGKEIKDWELDGDITDELERKQNERRKELDKEGEVRTQEILKMLAR